MIKPVTYYRRREHEGDCSERMLLRDQLNAGLSRPELEEKFGDVWDTAEFTKEFRAINFYAPFVFVQRGNSFGTVLFQHWPRYYFCWRTQEVSEQVASSILQIIPIEAEEHDR